MRLSLRSLFARPSAVQQSIGLIRQHRMKLARCADADFKLAYASTSDVYESMAVTAVVASRLLGVEMFDIQLQGALALAGGKIAEMQTGEGKTLAAVPAVAWFAKKGSGVHVMTVNDYLARRDAKWMGGIYEFLGLSVGCIQQTLRTTERRLAYSRDVTYGTANEMGFNYLRDQLAMQPDEQVHRPFAVAVLDEVDSLLIDEARNPLVIAGDETDENLLARRVDALVRHFRRNLHYSLDEYGRNVALTDAGIQALESAFACGNLFLERNHRLLVAIQDSLHARVLLRDGVDYVVKDGAIEAVDEFKGRIVHQEVDPLYIQSVLHIQVYTRPTRHGRNRRQLIQWSRSSGRVPQSSSRTWIHARERPPDIITRKNGQEEKREDSSRIRRCIAAAGFVRSGHGSNSAANKGARIEIRRPYPSPPDRRTD
jgi:SecA-like ATPase subunit of protein translocation complex